MNLSLCREVLVIETHLFSLVPASFGNIRFLWNGVMAIWRRPIFRTSISYTMNLLTGTWHGFIISLNQFYCLQFSRPIKSNNLIMDIFYGSLIVLALLCAGTQYLSGTRLPATKNVNFMQFQRSYLGVYLLAMAADWLQGPHVYVLYER